jgi:archaeal flagellin FlaB
MGRKRTYLFKNKKASIGIGAMIVFIAMVLVAGIAANVIIQTSVTLESQSMATGLQTTSEVSAGLSVCAIEGYVESSSANISKLAILVRPKAGTESIDLSGAFIEITDMNTKVLLNYTSAYYLKPSGLNDIFSANVFPNHSSAADSTRFGILVMEDADGSVSSSSPLINLGDKVYLCLNTTGVFGDIPKRTNIWGMVVPEEGAPAMIEFITPGTYSNNVMELFWNM